MGFVKLVLITLLFVACDKMDKLGLQPGPEQAVVEAFNGVKNLTQTADGKYVLKWDVPVNLNNANYKIYLHQYKDKSALSNLPASSVDASENPLSGIGLLQLSDDKAPIKLGNLIATIPDAASFALDFSLETGITYAFQVRMIKDGVTDANATVLVYTPSSAKLNFAGITDGQITNTGKLLLNWEMPTDVGDVMMNDISYEIYMDATPVPLQQTIVGSLAVSGAGLSDLTYENGKIYSFKPQSLPSYANAPIAKVSGKRFFQYDEALLDGKTYIFQVKAKGPNKEQDNNNKVFVYRAGLENLEPFIGISELTTPNHGEVLIKWEKTDNKAVIGYKIYGEDFTTPVKVIRDPQTTSFKIVGLTPNAKVSYSVRAFDKNNHEDSNTRTLSIDVLNNQLPTFLGVSLVKQQNASDIAISWQPATGQPKEYRIYQVAKPVGSAVSIADFDFSTPIKTVLAPSMGVILNNAGDDQGYHFVVRAAVEGGAEEQNTVIKSVNMADNGAPIFEGIQTIATVSGAIKVGWSSAKGQVSNYKVYASTNAATLFQAVNFKVSTEGTLTQATVSDLGDNATWYLGVRAIDRHNQEDSNSISKSLTVGDMTPPIFLGYNAPGVSAVANNETKLNLTFKRSSESDVTFYSVKVKKSGSSQNLSQVMTVTQPANGDINTQINGLLGNTAYDVLVNAVDSSGNVSTNTATVSATTADLTPPSFLGVKTVTRDTANAPLDVVVKWDKPLANEAVAYRIYYAKQAFSTENFSKANTYPLTVNGVTIGMKLIQDANIVERKFRIVDELDQNTTYYFVVRSTDAAGNEDSNTAQISYVVPTVTPPVFNGLASATLEGGTRDVLLQWIEPTGSNSAASYLVYYSTTPNNPRVWSDPIVVAAPATSYKISNLTELQTYYFKVYARNIEGIADTNQVQRSALVLDITPPVFAGIGSIVNDSANAAIKLRFSAADDTPGTGVKEYRIFWREYPNGVFGSVANKTIHAAAACPTVNCEVSLSASDGLINAKSYEFRIDAADLTIPANVEVHQVRKTHLFPIFTAPTNNSIQINGGDVYTNLTSAVLTLASSGATEMYITNDAGCNTGGFWEAMQNSKSWNISSLSSQARVYVKFRDQFENTTACINDLIVYDAEAPSAVSVSIDNNAPSTRVSNVTLTLAATDVTDLQMYITDVAGCASGSVWENFVSSKAWTLSASNGTVSVYVKFKDQVGLESACVSDSILHDSTAPSATSVAINNGDVSTGTLSVTLNLAATDATSMEMYVTSTAGCGNGGNWEAFAATKSWTLLQSGVTNTVYVKYRDFAGNESGCVSDTILHDTAAPTGATISVNAGAAYATSVNVTLTLNATDASPLQMYVTNTAGCTIGGNWETFAASKSWVLQNENATNIVYVKYKDLGGLQSNCIADSIIHDNTPPTSPNVLINNNEAYTDNTSVTLNLSAVAADYMAITNTVDCGGTLAWQLYATTYNWTLEMPTGSNSGSVYVKFKDVAGNMSDCISDSIINASTYWALPQNLPSYTSLGSNTIQKMKYIGGKLYFLTSKGLSISADNGVTWTTKTSSNGIPYPYDIHYFNGKLHIGTSLGLLTSSDDGNTWVKATSGPTNIIGSITSYGSNLYALSVQYGYLYISSNNGSTWTTKTLPTSTVGNHVEVVGGTIFISASNGVHISTDGGNTWVTKNTSHGLPSNSTYDIKTFDGTTLYVGANGGLGVSNDGGNTWTAYTVATHGFVNNTIWEIGLGDNGDIILATSGGISISSNGGATWVNKTTTHGLINNVIQGLLVTGTNIYAYSSGSGVALSTNSGSSFSTFAVAPATFTMSALKIKTDGTDLFIVGSGGVYKSTNYGLSWSLILNLNSKDIVFANNKIYVATNSSGMRVSADQGTNWTTINTTSGIAANNTTSLIVRDNTIILGTSSGLSISTDDGATWVNRTISHGLTSNSITDVEFDGSNIFVSSGNELHKSIDGGISFTVLRPSSSFGTVGLAMFGTSLYALSTSTGFMGWSRTTDGGTTFLEKTGITPLCAYESGSIVYLCNSPSNYSSTSSGIAITTDNGTTYSYKAASVGLPGSPVDILLFNGSVYAIVSGNVYILNPPFTTR